MSNRKERDYLLDILEAAKRILEYTKDMEHEVFIRDPKTQDAVVRNIEIIGEAAKNISTSTRLRYGEIPTSVAPMPSEKL